ncbi:unnamed protein product [Cercopithifilaria johnstoni]|uniref:Uncharacterized protein n=1 Tax=Cercopithifilaria johnstoni TaxID=2874296 RepID=A0A8J2PXD7_9BILA|nr:unnamed protein product [Cercopithifilaria johnstoni]
MSKKISSDEKLSRSTSRSEQSSSVVHTDSVQQGDVTEDSPTEIHTGRYALRSIPIPRRNITDDSPTETYTDRSHTSSQDEPESPPLISGEPSSLPNLARPQPSYMLQSATLATATIRGRKVLGTSPRSAFSSRLCTPRNPSPSIRPASQTLRATRASPAKVASSDDSSVNQGDNEPAPLPQVSFLPFGYFPRGPRPLNAGDHPLYRYINIIADLSRPDNSWVQDYHTLLRLGVTPRENIGPDYMIQSTIALARVLNVVVNRIRVSQNFDDDFLDSLHLASQQLRQNAIAYSNTTREGSEPGDHEQEQQEE